MPIYPRIRAITIGLLMLGCARTNDAAAQRASHHGLASVGVRPDQPLIERRGDDQLINFDFILTNSGRVPLRLNAIRVSVRDAKGALEVRRFIDDNGFAPGLSTVVQTLLGPGASIKIYNPFYTFDPDVDVGRLDYDFFFEREASVADRARNTRRLPVDYDYSAHFTVYPHSYAGRTDLVLPLRARAIVFDGHDFYAHHRRQPQGLPGHRNTNSVRYAYDFMVVDSSGATHRGDGYKASDWFGYGRAIVAPGSGVVVSAVNDIPDNTFYGRLVRHPAGLGDRDPDGLGNHVVIDHGNGEFSALVHMKPGSVRVRKGDHVTQGQIIGAVGFSGDTFLPHLHYQVMNTAEDSTGEGLPSYFGRFYRVLGSRKLAVKRGDVDSGDIVEPMPEPVRRQRN